MRKMNFLKMAFVVGFALISMQSFAIGEKGGKTETFKVYGNCGMCEQTIEGSLSKVKGVKKADWNKETKEMKVTYNDKKISLDEIKQKIAAVGYDTDKFRASDAAYNGLHGCCQYERPGLKQKTDDGHKGHQH